MLSIQEYREILKDDASSDEQIKKRLQYLEVFCRNVTKLEVENYVQKIRQGKKRR